MFRLDKLTQKAQEALQQSQALAESGESQVMFPLHLLISLADEKEGFVKPLLVGGAACPALTPRCSSLV